MTQVRNDPAPAPADVPAAASIAARSLRLSYRPGRVIVDDLDLDLPTGEVTAVIGANGSGKSTVLRALSRLLRPAAGQVLLDGADLHRMRTREVATRLGLLPQSPVCPEGITVRDLVRRGRTPHTSLWRQWSAEDEAALNSTLAATELTELADEQVDALSGGQRQRAWLALVIAQGTPLLLLTSRRHSSTSPTRSTCWS